MGVVNTNDTLLIKLAKGCSNLTCLRLGPCADITDTGVAAFSSLRTLVLSGCSAVNDSGVLAAAQGCKALDYMTIFDNPNITDAGLEAVLSSSSSLKTLRCYQCTQVSPSMLEKLDKLDNCILILFVP